MDKLNIIVIVILATAVALVVYMAGDQSAAEAACRAKGGALVVSRDYHKFCIKSEAIVW